MKSTISPPATQGIERASNPVGPSVAPAYDRVTVALHWLTALLVVLLWGSAQLIDLFPRGEARWPMRSTHMLMGVMLAGVVLWRLVWRSTRGTRLRPPGSEAAQVLAHAVHGVLYALLVSEVVLGIANTWVRGDHFFHFFQIPAFDPGNTALKKSIENIHEWVANAILAVAGAHAMAALFHHFALRDGLLHRMRPSPSRHSNNPES